MSTLTFDGNSLLYVSRYNPALVADLKARIPASDRQWDKQNHAWRVTPQFGNVLVQITAQYLGEHLTIPAVPVTTATVETRLLNLLYLGMCKTRDNGEPTAFGWVDGAWSVIFPESGLRKWFCAPSKPNETATLYQMLGIESGTSADEIKHAYRRLARQWHPDVCKEPDAEAQFKTINHAYGILADPGTRARYDAGLAFTATLARQTSDDTAPPQNLSYRAPLRCGWVMAEGTAILSKFKVANILAWEDIVRADGLVLNTTWPAGAEMFEERWV